MTQSIREKAISEIADALARRRSGSFHPSLGIPWDVEVLPEDRADAAAAFDAAIQVLMEPDPAMAHAGQAEGATQVRGPDAFSMLGASPFGLVPAVEFKPHGEVAIFRAMLLAASQ